MPIPNRAPMVLAGLAAFLLAGPARPTAPAPDEAAIRRARSAQNAAMAVHNADSAATFWTDDVTIRRGLGQMVIGREAYRKMLVPAGAYDADVVYQRNPDRVEVSSQWPLAYESGTWTGRIGGKGPAVIAGRYGAQWVRREGRWLIRSEVFVALSCSGPGCAFQAAP